MNWRTTVGLLIVAAALGVALLLLKQRNANAPATPTTAPPAKLFDIQESDVVSFTVRNNISVTVTALTREGANWKFREPPKLAGVVADANRVQTASSQLAAMTAVQTLTQTMDLTAIGLATPAYTIRFDTLKGNQSQTHTLQVGKKSFDGSDYYVRKDSDPAIYLVSALSVESLTNVISSPPLVTPSPTPAPTATPGATAKPSPAPTGAP